MATGKVLVLGDDTRSFLAIVRSLGRQRLRVHVAPINFCSVALRSRYIAKIHCLPPLTGDGAAWLASLEDLVRAENFTLVVPCADRALLPLHANRDRFAGLTLLAIPEPEHIDTLFDKVHTRELAASLGVSLAPGLHPDRPIDPDEVFAQLGSPVVVKPRRSVLPDALHRQEQVQIVSTPDELREATADRECGSYFFEAFFPGFGLGVSVLADRGVILQSFQHHRVHQAARGGSSAYRVSAPLSADLIAACEKIVGRINYTGIAMFEFRREVSGENWVLLEVNARPWGSMPLPVALGVDFPFAWYQLLAAAVRIPQRPYRTEVYGRNLDLDIAFATKQWSELKNTKKRLAFVTRWFFAFGRTLIGQEKLDTFAIDDPAPAVAECRAIASRLIRHCCERVSGYQMLRRTVARVRLRRALAKAVRAGRTPSIVFVCYGNICRSVFAERLLTNTLTPLTNRVHVRSAGTYQVAGRSSPHEAIEAACRHGTDLATHRSQCITQPVLDAATVLIVFDRSNIETLNSQFAKITCPVIRLGSLICAGDRAGDIYDPYGGGSTVFDRSFALIEQGVAALRGLILDVFAARTVS